MRIFTDVDEEHERVVVTYAGSIILHDVMEMMFTSEKARVLEFSTLIDARNAPIELSGGDLNKIQQTEADMATRQKINKCAILVGSELEWQKADAAAKLLQPIAPIQAFLDRAQAEHWLGWR